MEFFKILSKESPLRALYVLVMSVISGISGGAIVPLVVHAAENAMSGSHCLNDLFLLPLTSALLVLTKRISQQQTAIVTERALENLIVRFANNTRHAELLVIEERSRSDMFLTVADAQTVTHAATKMVDMCQNIITIVVCWFYIFWLSPQAGLVFVLMCLFAVLVAELFHKATNPMLHDETEKEKRLFDLFDHILDGFKEIKISRVKNDDLFENYLRPLVVKIREIRTGVVILSSEYRLFVLISFLIVMGMDVFVLSSFYSHKIVIRILTVTLYITTPMMIVLTAAPDIANGRMAMERFCQLAQEDEHGVSKTLCPSSEEVVRHFKTLTLENIRFEYRAGDDAAGFSLGPVSLTIGAGEILFVCGGNGSGKSTLIKVLSGLYPPDSGIIMLDKTQVEMADHRYLFSIIFNDFHLFDGLYGIDAVDDQKVRQLLARMEMASQVRWTGTRFSTTELSTGQRKRLALVAALMEDKLIYVFDEWAADQDPHFRQYFYESLVPSFREQGKTVIAVTHDDRYFHAADRVIKMEYGKIIKG